MKINSQIIGLYVVTNDSEDATVFQVVKKHESRPAYLLTYPTKQGVVSGGWTDISLISPATPTQIAQQFTNF